MKHTPGPWKWNNIFKDFVGAIMHENGTQQIAHALTQHKMYSSDHEISLSEAKANARLIAASPTMLTLCKGALAALSQNKTFPGDIDVAKAFLANAIAAAETL